MAYLQDAVVTLVALWAGLVVFRRVAGFVKPAATPGCANCPSATVKAAAGGANAAPAVRPLLFIRSERR